MTELVPIRNDRRRELNRFIRVPESVYGDIAGGDMWVAPLHRELRARLSPRNPFFAHADARFWVATQNGRDVGRIAAFADDDWQAAYPGTAAIGLFECVNQPTVARSLFGEATRWLATAGIRTALGPIDLSTNYQTGLLVHGFDQQPSVGMPFNPPYYLDLFEDSGWRADRELLEWSVTRETVDEDRIARIARRVIARDDVVVRRMRKRDWDAEFRTAWEIYNLAWKANWGFVPLRLEEFSFIAAQLRPLLCEEFALVAEIGGTPVAFSITIPDVNEVLATMHGRLLPTGWWRLLRGIPRLRRARMVLLGVDDRYRNRGVDAVLIHRTLEAGRALEYDGAVMGWTAVDATAIAGAIRRIGGVESKRFRVYRRDVE